MKAGHGAEARPEHDLDRRDGSARQDVRQPDGRRGREQREAARAGAAGRRAGHRRPCDQADAALEAADGEAKVAIVSLLAGLDAAGGAPRLAARGGVVRRALEGG